MGWPKEAYLHLRQIVTPKSRPQPGGNLLYIKSDNNLYLLNADGTEHQVGGGDADLPTLDIVAYGAKVDGVTDDTTPVQSALNDAGAMGGARIISSKAGVCLIAGPLQDPTGANAQLLLPSVDAVDSKNISIVIEGAFPPPATVSVIGATPLPDNQLVFKSTLTTGNGALLGGIGPTTTYNNFTNVDLRIVNVTFRLPSNPTNTGLDLRNVVCVGLDRVIVDCGGYYVQGLTQPTTTTSFAIRLPKINNGAHVRLGKVDVIGFYNGYEINEHTFGEYVAAWGCNRAATFTQANHASTFARLMAVHCPVGLVFTGGAHYVDIWQFDIEHASSGWWTTTADIYDVSNYGHGLIRWHVVLADVGPDNTFTVSGGTNLQTSQVGTALGGGSSYSLTVQDENANVSTSVTQIDFQGAGVTATAGTGEVVVTIPGGSATELGVMDGITNPPELAYMDSGDDYAYMD